MEADVGILRPCTTTPLARLWLCTAATRKLSNKMEKGHIMLLDAVDPLRPWRASFS
jgi:hypothetical protein